MQRNSYLLTLEGNAGAVHDAYGKLLASAGSCKGVKCITTPLEDVQAGSSEPPPPTAKHAAENAKNTAKSAGNPKGGAKSGKAAAVPAKSSDGESKHNHAANRGDGIPPAEWVHVEGKNGRRDRPNKNKLEKRAADKKQRAEQHKAAEAAKAEAKASKNRQNKERKAKVAAAKEAAKAAPTATSAPPTGVPPKQAEQAAVPPSANTGAADASARFHVTFNGKPTSHGAVKVIKRGQALPKESAAEPPSAVPADVLAALGAASELTPQHPAIAVMQTTMCALPTLGQMRVGAELALRGVGAIWDASGANNHCVLHSTLGGMSGMDPCSSQIVVLARAVKPVVLATAEALLGLSTNSDPAVRATAVYTRAELGLSEDAHVRAAIQRARAGGEVTAELGALVQGMFPDLVMPIHGFLPFGLGGQDMGFRLFQKGATYISGLPSAKLRLAKADMDARAAMVSVTQIVGYNGTDRQVGHFATITSVGENVILPPGAAFAVTGRYSTLEQMTTLAANTSPDVTALFLMREHEKASFVTPAGARETLPEYQAAYAKVAAAFEPVELADVAATLRTAREEVAAQENAPATPPAAAPAPAAASVPMAPPAADQRSALEKLLEQVLAQKPSAAEALKQAQRNSDVVAAKAARLAASAQKARDEALRAAQAEIQAQRETAEKAELARRKAEANLAALQAGVPAPAVPASPPPAAASPAAPPSAPVSPSAPEAVDEELDTLAGEVDALVVAGVNAPRPGQDLAVPPSQAGRKRRYVDVVAAAAQGPPAAGSPPPAAAQPSAPPAPKRVQTDSSRLIERAKAVFVAAEAAKKNPPRAQ